MRAKPSHFNRNQANFHSQINSMQKKFAGVEQPYHLQERAKTGCFTIIYINNR
jgi:hypothetical protein